MLENRFVDMLYKSTYYGRSDQNIVILLQYWKIAPYRLRHTFFVNLSGGGKKEVASLKKFTFDRIHET